MNCTTCHEPAQAHGDKVLCGSCALKDAGSAPKRLTDVLDYEADFEGVTVGRRALDLLALFWAVSKYDSDIRRGGKFIAR